MALSAQTFEVLDALERRFTAEGEHVFWREWNYIDAFAIRAWGQPAHRRVAFEVKVSRSDFLSEMRKPTKRNYGLEVSHEFYFVTPPKLVSADEVPTECGLMVVKDGRSRIVKKAPVREARSLWMAEVVSLMRRPMFRSGVLEMRREMRVLESVVEHAREREERTRDDLCRALDRLEQFGGHLVEKGSVWRGGPWYPRSWIPDEFGVTCYVEEIGEQGTLTLRRFDTGDVWRFVRKADLLANFEHVADSRIASVPA